MISKQSSRIAVPIGHRAFPRQWTTTVCAYLHLHSTSTCRYYVDTIYLGMYVSAGRATSRLLSRTPLEARNPTSSALATHTYMIVLWTVCSVAGGNGKQLANISHPGRNACPWCGRQQAFLAPRKRGVLLGMRRKNSTKVINDNAYLSCRGAYFCLAGHT